MSLKHLEAADERDALEFINVGLSRENAVRLLRRILRESPELVTALKLETALDFAAALVADAWLYGATAARHALHGRHVCHVCGCSETNPCVAQGEACAWVDHHLCSECEI